MSLTSFRAAPPGSPCEGYGQTCLYCAAVVHSSALLCLCGARKGHKGDVAIGLRVLAWSSTVGPASYLAYRRAQIACAEARVRPLADDLFNVACVALAVLLAYGLHRIYTRVLGTAWDPAWIK